MSYDGNVSQRGRRIKTKGMVKSRSVESSYKRARVGGVGLRKFLYILMLLLLLLGLAALIRRASEIVEIYRNATIQDPYSFSDTPEEADNSGVERLLLIVEEPVSAMAQPPISAAYLLFRNLESGEILYVYIPGWVYMPVNSVRNGSKYVALRDLSYYGSTVGFDPAGSYALLQLQDALGVQIDSYIWVGGETQAFIGFEKKSSTKLGELNHLLSGLNFQKFFLTPSNSKYLSEGIKSNLNVVELFDKAKVYSATEPDELNFLDLSESWGTQPYHDGTGRDMRVMNFDEFDKRFAEYINIVRPREIQKEQAKVEIFNASDISGLARRYSRKMQNNGLNTVRVSNSQTPYTKTTVYVSNTERFQYSLKLVKQLIPVDIEVVEGRPNFLTTADIVIVIAADLLPVQDSVGLEE